MLDDFFKRWKRSEQALLPDGVDVRATSGLDEICPVFANGLAKPTNAATLAQAWPRETESSTESSFTPQMVRGVPDILGTGYIEVKIPAAVPTGNRSTGRAPLREQMVFFQFFIFLPATIRDLLLGSYCGAIASALRRLRYGTEVFRAPNTSWAVGDRIGIHTMDQIDEIPNDPEEVGPSGEYHLDVFPVAFRRRHFSAPTATP